MVEIPQGRCFEESEGPLMKRYHDEEWGTPLHDDRLLFEFLSLCGRSSWPFLDHDNEQKGELPQGLRWFSAK